MAKLACHMARITFATTALCASEIAATAGETTRVSVSSSEVQANGKSFRPAISADGRFVALQSGANNLVGGDTNSTVDVFVRDTQAGTTRRVSVSSSGAQAEESDTGSHRPGH